MLQFLLLLLPAGLRQCSKLWLDVGSEILSSPFNLELSGRLAEVTIYFRLGAQLHVPGWRDQNASLMEMQM